jgi:hypothetical protein
VSNRFSVEQTACLTETVDIAGRHSSLRMVNAMKLVKMDDNKIGLWVSLPNGPHAPEDYCCLHRDLYGEHVFPIQIVILLNQPGEDFDGGEFVMTEQRPRMQTRAMVLPLQKGNAAIVAVNARPTKGVRGDYQVKLSHGVSKLYSGKRRTAGIIFHDAI